METGVALRALAMTSIIAGHAGILKLPGPGVFLFTLVGYGLARFQGPQLTRGRVISALLPYLTKVAVPYFLDR